MKRCIMCLNSGQPESVEHIFPKAIGGNMTIKICKKCNDYMGREVDCHLVDNFFIKIYRSEFSLAGQSGKVPHLFQGQYKTKDGSKVDMICDSDGRPNECTFISKVSSNPDDPSQRVISVDQKNKKEIPKIYNKLRMRSGLPPISDKEFFNKMDSGEISSITRDHPTLATSVTMNFHELERAVAKIAYQLAFYWYGEAILEHSIFNDLREYVMRVGDFKKLRIRGGLEMTGLPEDNQMQGFHQAFTLDLFGMRVIQIYIFSILKFTLLISEGHDSWSTPKNNRILLNVKERTHSVSSFLQ